MNLIHTLITKGYMISYQIKALHKNFLLLLLGGQRMNIVYFFTVDKMTVTDTVVTFSPNHVLKHSKPGKLDSFHYKAVAKMPKYFLIFVKTTLSNMHRKM